MKIKAEIVFKVLEYAVIIICGITNLYKDEHADKKEKQPMFTNRYITKGVQLEIPIVLQLFIWDCINAVPEPKDYLQVFRFSVSNGKQKIIHEQEQPEFKREYLLTVPNPVTTKVYVIDSETYSTMLLAEEY